MNAPQPPANVTSRLNASVLIPDDECGYSRFLPFCLKQVDPGLRVVVAGTRPGSLTRHSRYVDHYVDLPGRDNTQDRAADWREVIQKAHIDWLMPASENGTRIAIRHYSELSAHAGIVSLPSGHALAVTSDKWQQFLQLQPRGVHMPPTERLDPERPPPWFPCIIKPRRGSRGLGIHLIQDASAWRRFDFSTLQDEYIAQRYVRGHDIDCSVFCDRGEVVAHTVQVPLGTESGFAPRIQKLKFESDHEVVEIARLAMRALDWQGVAHLDLRIDAATGQCLLVEINPRYWASIMGSYYNGVNFPAIALRNSLGLPAPQSDCSGRPVNRPGDRYYVSLGRMVRDSLRGQRDYGLGETQLPFIASDPLPALARIWQKLTRQADM